MTINKFAGFSAFCKSLGLTTLAEVDAVLRGNCILYKVCINGVSATAEDMAELVRRVMLGKEIATVINCNDFIYIKTMEEQYAQNQMFAM